ncbi:MAG: two-component sensor histidine kinase [Pseudonocardiales bacterium]|nr:MAG: two-component sensor histidine kinase [Pseudonocardiales bacterium]
MGIAVGVVTGLIVGLLVGVTACTWWRRRPRSGPPARRPVPGEASPEQVVPIDVLRHIPEQMHLAVVVLDESSDVALANPAVRKMGIVRGGHLIVEELHRLARIARETGVTREVSVDLPDSRLGHEPLAVQAVVAPLGESGHVALFLEDVTELRRLSAVRRDFVANISHELKTPVGALSLLGETIEEAADDPEAVSRFARRVQQEGHRLGRLVQELIELSRLEGADPLPSAATAVPVDRVVEEAVDQTRLAAESAGITVVCGGQRGLSLRGDQTQLVTALANLVGNAIAYSPAGTRVAVGTKLRVIPGEHRNGGRYVEVSVADQGIGIAEADLQRIFERFYRADPARSRATGGTGLGLAIVKHIASNHGGRLNVWSALGSGSTFTLQIPAASTVDPAAEPLQPAEHRPASELSSIAPVRRTTVDVKGAR